MSGQARWSADNSGRVAAAAEAARLGLALPRLLAIDSDNLHRMIICRAADKAGYIPAGAANFTEAARLLQAEAFDCITLALSLGRQTGDMLRHLREIDCDARLLIVANRDAAGCRETLHFARSLGLDVGEPVPTPVDVGMLRDALEQMKARRGFGHGLVAAGAA